MRAGDRHGSTGGRAEQRAEAPGGGGTGLTAPRQTWEWLYNSRTPLIQMEEQTI